MKLSALLISNFKGINDMKEEFHEALVKDLGWTSLGVTTVFGFAPTIKAIEHTIAHVD